jgi:hypothetical protein
MKRIEFFIKKFYKSYTFFTTNRQNQKFCNKTSVTFVNTSAFILNEKPTFSNFRIIRFEYLVVLFFFVVLYRFLGCFRLSKMHHDC